MLVLYFFFSAGGIYDHKEFLPMQSYAQLPVDTIVKLGRELSSGEDFDENKLTPVWNVLNFPGAMPVLGFDEFLWLRKTFTPVAIS